MHRMRLATVLVALGCARSAPTFTLVGDGIAVPTERVTAYSQSHGVTRDKARKALLAEIDAANQRERSRAEASAANRN
ncbi:MAG: hypothetical protein KF847_03275 [Pirellulales bacterium]|nr:hypothetical protein [Pirellulales bacterium]